MSRSSEVNVRCTKIGGVDVVIIGNIGIVVRRRQVFVRLVSSLDTLQLDRSAELNWRRSIGGLTESHCGRWKITPLHAGCRGMFKIWFDGRVVSGHHLSQQDAKIEAGRLANDLL